MNNQHSRPHVMGNIILITITVSEIWDHCQNLLDVPRIYESSRLIDVLSDDHIKICCRLIDVLSDDHIKICCRLIDVLSDRYIKVCCSLIDVLNVSRVVFSLFHHRPLIGLDCFSVVMHYISWEPSMRAKHLCFVLTTTEPRANNWR